MPQQFTRSIKSTLALAAVSILAASSSFAADEKYFNKYIVDAVEDLAKTRSGLGYGPAAFTKDVVIFGSVLWATKPPLTMCVAAQVEIISKALEIYERDS